MTKSYPVYFNQWYNPLCKLQGSPPQKQILAPLELGESKVGRLSRYLCDSFLLQQEYNPNAYGLLNLMNEGP